MTHYMEIMCVNHNIYLIIKSWLLTCQFLKKTNCQLIIANYMSSVIEMPNGLA